MLREIESERILIQKCIDLIHLERSFPTAHDPWKAKRVMLIIMTMQSTLLILAHVVGDFSAFKYYRAGITNEI